MDYFSILNKEHDCELFIDICRHEDVLNNRFHDDRAGKGTRFLGRG